MKSMIVISILLVNISFADEIFDPKLKKSIEQVTVHVRAIEDEAKKYLESSIVDIESDDNIDVLIRKLAIEQSQTKDNLFSPLTDKKQAQEEKKKQSEVTQALAANNMEKLKTIVMDDLASKQKDIIKSTVSLMIDIASGKKSPRLITQTKVINGKVTTEKTEKESYEVYKLKKLVADYSETTHYLKIISANKGVERTR